MLVSQKIAIAAHLHVLLRRKTGRVTDTEWMAGNLEYALEIVRFARAKAAEDGHEDLQAWADKLESAVLEPSPVNKPLAQSALRMLKERTSAATVPGALAPSRATSGFEPSTFSDAGFADSVPEPGRAPKPRDPDSPRYVGGIR